MHQLVIMVTIIIHYWYYIIIIIPWYNVMVHPAVHETDPRQTPDVTTKG